MPPRRFVNARWPFAIIAVLLAVACAFSVSLVRDELQPPKPTPHQLLGVQTARGTFDPVFNLIEPPAKNNLSDLAKPMFATVVTGLAMIISLAALIRPVTLTLDHEGFTIRSSTGLMTRVRWLDLERVFYLGGSMKRRPSVAWRFPQGFSAASATAEMSRQIWGFDGMVSGWFELPAHRLANLMESYRLDARERVSRFQKYEGAD